MKIKIELDGYELKAVMALVATVWFGYEGNPIVAAVFAAVVAVWEA